ncbi:hypothetical protein FB597_103265 [Herbaspirillum sp. SJZ099]|nr:hypothetical protein FB597_103265 [Herbaspirillum sp. SJZ099]
MLGIWLIAALMLLILPFQLLARPLTGYGVLVLAAFFIAFVTGSLLVPPAPRADSAASYNLDGMDYAVAERVLIAIGLISIIAFCLDLSGRNLLDISGGQELRSQRANTLLRAQASSSTAWFQIAFLTYPAGYAYIALHTIYVRAISCWRLSLFGFLPILLSILSMGGRSPLLYAMTIFGLAYLTRRKSIRSSNSGAKSHHLIKPKSILIVLGITLSAIAAGYYFSVIFIVRSEAMGGPEAMFKLAESVWGVGFKGSLSEQIFTIFGERLTYLIFIFSWYFVQGLVIASNLFSDYNGPLQFGIYGIDLVSALVRRGEPETVAHGFLALLSLGTYGFFPSAFGSLFVDFGLAGLFMTVLWGYAATLCYRKIKFERKGKWLIFAPFVTAGIVFSLINTPLGFANGLVSHAWMLLTFSLLRQHRSNPTIQAPASLPTSE